MLAQSRVRNVLDRMLSSNRVAHALLFHGPHGAGKRAAALAFAGALQAGRSSLDAGTGDETYGRVQRMLHPDVHVFFPYPRDTSETDIAERLGLLGANPYAEIDYVRRPSLADPTKTSNKQAFYPVKRINDELKRVMSFRPHEGRYKVAILIGADTLRVEAANAFLKLLEEPAPNTVFILTTSRPDRILPTILSRCQRVRFDALAPEVIEHALVQQRQLDPVQAATIARMAAGSYTRAIELASNPRLIEQRAAVVEFFRVVFAFDGGKLADFVEQQGKAGREQTKGFFGLTLAFVRDLMLYRELRDEAPLVNVDQRATIARFVDAVPNADLAGMVQMVEEATYLAERNVHLTLVLTTLAGALNQLMHGRSRDTLIPNLMAVG